METDLASRIPEWERQAAEYEQKARALRQIIEGVRALNGEAAQLLSGVWVQPVPTAPSQPVFRPPAEVPRGRAAVRLIASERPGVWKVSDMKAEIVRRGWGDPGTGTEAAMKRLAASGECVKVGHGLYRFGPTPGTELVLATGEGD